MPTRRTAPAAIASREIRRRVAVCAGTLLLSALSITACGREEASRPDAALALIDSEFDFDAATPKERVVHVLGGCAGSSEADCHASGAGRLFLPDPSLARLIDVPAFERPDLLLVAPHRPLDSYLYLKVLGDGGIEGGPMPPSAPLDPRASQAIFDWIQAGAPSFR